MTADGIEAVSSPEPARIYQIVFPVGENPQAADSALCAQSDPEIFFPEKGGATAPAKRVCAKCPARLGCLAYALDIQDAFGIWGGYSERERRRILKGDIYVKGLSEYRQHQQNLLSSRVTDEGDGEESKMKDRKRATLLAKFLRDQVRSEVVFGTGGNAKLPKELAEAVDTFEPSVLMKVVRMMADTGEVVVTEDARSRRIKVKLVMSDVDRLQLVKNQVADGPWAVTANELVTLLEIPDGHLPRVLSLLQKHLKVEGSVQGGFTVTGKDADTALSKPATEIPVSIRLISERIPVIMGSQCSKGVKSALCVLSLLEAIRLEGWQYQPGVDVVAEALPDEVTPNPRDLRGLLDLLRDKTWLEAKWVPGNAATRYRLTEAGKQALIEFEAGKLDLDEVLTLPEPDLPEPTQTSKATPPTASQLPSKKVSKRTDSAIWMRNKLTILEMLSKHPDGKWLNPTVRAVCDELPAGVQISFDSMAALLPVLAAEGLIIIEKVHLRKYDYFQITPLGRKMLDKKTSQLAELTEYRPNISSSITVDDGIEGEPADFMTSMLRQPISKTAMRVMAILYMLNQSDGVWENPSARMIFEQLPDEIKTIKISVLLADMAEEGLIVVNKANLRRYESIVLTENGHNELEKFSVVIAEEELDEPSSVEVEPQAPIQSTRDDVELRVLNAKIRDLHLELERTRRGHVSQLRDLLTQVDALQKHLDELSRLVKSTIEANGPVASIHVADEAAG